MRLLSLLTIMILLLSVNTFADNRCQLFEKRLNSIKAQLKKRTENFRELQFQKNKLEKRIDKKCVGLNKKLENAFIKSSLLND